MKNKRVKLESDESDEAPFILVSKKKKIRGVSDAELKKTAKITIKKKLAGFSQGITEKSDLLSDIPSTVSQVSYRTNNQIEEIDLYREFKEKVLEGRVRARANFLLEIQSKREFNFTINATSNDSKNKNP